MVRLALKPFRPGRCKPSTFEASLSAEGVELPSSLVSDGFGAGVEVPILLPVMEDTHAKVACDGFAGVTSLPVPDLPASSVGVFASSSDTGLKPLVVGESGELFV